MIKDFDVFHEVIDTDPYMIKCCQIEKIKVSITKKLKVLYCSSWGGLKKSKLAKNPGKYLWKDQILKFSTDFHDSKAFSKKDNGRKNAIGRLQLFQKLFKLEYKLIQTSALKLTKLYMSKKTKSFIYPEMAFKNRLLWITYHLWVRNLKVIKMLCGLYYPVKRSFLKCQNYF